MSDENPPIDKALNSVLDKATASPEFTEAEVKALRAVADVWRGLEAFGRVASFVKTVTQYVGWSIAVYVAFKAGLIDWLRSVVAR